MSVVNLKKPLEKVFEDEVGKKFLFGYIDIKDGKERFVTYISHDLDNVEACYLVDILNERRKVI